MGDTKAIDLQELEQIKCVSSFMHTTTLIHGCMRVPYNIYMCRPNENIVPRVWFKLCTAVDGVIVPGHSIADVKHVTFQDTDLNRALDTAQAYLRELSETASKKVLVIGFRHNIKPLAYTEGVVALGYSMKLMFTAALESQGFLRPENAPAVRIALNNIENVFMGVWNANSDSVHVYDYDERVHSMLKDIANAYALIGPRMIEYVNDCNVNGLRMLADALMSACVPNRLSNKPSETVSDKQITSTPTSV